MEVERDDRPSRRGWLWAIVGLVLVVGLISLAVSMVNRHETANAPEATTGSVQNSATGSQGAVGNFSENVVPNGSNGTQTGVNGQAGGSTGARTDMPPGSIPRTPADNGTTGRTSSGDDMGAGNSGITTTPTDTMGGAPVTNGNKRNSSGGTNSSTHANSGVPQ